MSKRRKNFHYHYAERYETKEERRAYHRRKRLFAISPVALVISLVMLVMFGLVSTTFSVYVTNSFDDPDIPEAGGLIVSVRNDEVRAKTESNGILPKKEAELAGAGAEVDLADTSLNLAGKRLYLSSSGRVSTDGANAKYRCAVFDEGGDATYYDVAASTVTDGDGATYYYVTIPSSETKTLYQWRRCNPSDNKVWNYGPVVSAKKNATYLDDSFNGSDFSGNTTTYSIFADGEVVYVDATKNGYWNSYDVSISNKTSWIGNNMTKIATGLYKYTQSGYWNNNGSDNLYFHRGGTAQSTWTDYSNSFSIGSAYFDGNNAMYMGDSDANNSIGLQTTLSLTSITTPSVSQTVDTFKGDVAHTITVSNHSDVKLNYSRGGSAKTTALIDKVYSFYLDNSATAAWTSNTSTCTIPANYFDGTSGKTYGQHTITVKASSALTGLTSSASTLTFTVKNPLTCIIYAAGESTKNYTLAVGSTQTVAVTSDHHNGNITVTSSQPDYVKVCSSINGTYSTTATVTNGNNVYIKAIAPYYSSSTLTAVPVELTCASSDATEVSESTKATVNVTVSEPTLTAAACSVEEYRDATLSIGTANPAPSSYSWAVKADSTGRISLGTSTSNSVTVNSISGYDSNNNTATVLITAHYATGYDKTIEATVTITASPVSIKGSLDNWTLHKMTYDSSADSYSHGKLYKYEVRLTGSQSYQFGIVDGNDYYSKSSVTISSSSTGCWVTNSSDAGISLDVNPGNGHDSTLSTEAEGVYTIYYCQDTHKLFVGDYPDIEYYLLGFNDWSKQVSQKMSETSSGSGVYTINKNCTAAETHNAGTTDGFKVWCNDGNYYGLSSTTISHSNRTATLQSNTSDSYNLGLNASYSGTYTFSFDTSNNLLTVTYPTRSLTVNALLNDTSTSLGSISIGGTSNFFTLTDNLNDTFTVAPKSHTQYSFVKWNDNNSTTGTRTITLTDSAAYTYNTSWNYRSYDITYNTNGGALASGTYDSVTTANQVYKGSYTHGTAKTLPDSTEINHPSGYVFAGWYENNSFTGSAVTSIPASATGNKVYYAKWTVTVTFKENIHDTQIGSVQTITVGGNATPPDRTTVDATLQAEGFTFSTWNGTYTNVTADTVVYAVYVPTPLQFTIMLTPSGNVTVDTSGDVPHYTIGYGATISCHAELTVPVAVNENIYYKWEASLDGTVIDSEYVDTTPQDANPPVAYDSTNRKYTFNRDDIVTLLTKPSGTYSLKARAYYCDARGNTVDSGNDVATYSITYQINSPFTAALNEMTLSPDQKIYSDTSRPDITANIKTSSSISNDLVTKLTSYYKTVIMSYDKMNSSADHYDDLSGNLPITGTVPDFSSTYLGSYVPNGVNYFKFKLMRLSDINDNTSDLVLDSITTVNKRTVVGTAQGKAARPLYIANNSGTTFDGKRVMVFYINQTNTLSYATATAFDHDDVAGADLDGEVYRFDIPAYVNKVSLGVFDPTKEYALPELDDGSLLYSRTGSSDPDEPNFTTNYFTYTDWVNITASSQKININGGVSSGSAIPQANITIGMLS